jgi:hypothetical protein
MNTRWTRTLILGVALITALLLTGCPAPTPATPAAPTVVPATPPPPTPTTPAPDGWTEHQSGDVTISLPADWEVLALSQGDLQAVFADFQKANPELAKIIGSAEALQGVALWAFKRADGVDADADFADNLNIRRSPLGGQKITDMTDVTPAILDQYRKLGFELGATENDLQIGSYPAAHIAFSYPVILSDGASAKLSGDQYLVATPTDLWILSYSAGPGNEDALKPVFEQSAQSFRVK